MDELQPLVSGYHKNSEDAIGNIFDVFLWVLKQMKLLWFPTEEKWMERFDHEKNQHIYLEEAGQNENVSRIAVLFLEKIPKYLILSRPLK